MMLLIFELYKSRTIFYILFCKTSFVTCIHVTPYKQSFVHCCCCIVFHSVNITQFTHFLNSVYLSAFQFRVKYCCCEHSYK